MKRTITFWLIVAVMAVTGTAQQGRYAGVSATRKVGEDTYLATKTVIKTFSVISTGSLDDCQFDNTAENSDEQPCEIAGIIPAYAEIVSAQLRCFETVAGGVAVIAATVGTSSGGDEVLGASNPDSANDIEATVAGNGPVIVATNAARSIWLNGDPPIDNWNTKTAGRWAVIITYIDYGAVYTADVP